MNTWMNGKSLTKQYYLKEFYNNLNMEDIIDAACKNSL